MLSRYDCSSMTFFFSRTWISSDLHCVKVTSLNTWWLFIHYAHLLASGLHSLTLPEVASLIMRMPNGSYKFDSSTVLAKLKQQCIVVCLFAFSETSGKTGWYCNEKILQSKQPHFPFFVCLFFVLQGKEAELGCFVLSGDIIYFWARKM